MILDDKLIGLLLFWKNWRVRLLNKSNYEVEKLAHKDFYDMFISLTVYVEDKNAEYLVTNEQFKKLEKIGFEEEKIFSVAKQNTLNSIIKDLCIIEVCKDNDTMYQLCCTGNRDSLATLLLFNDAMQVIRCFIGEGFFIFPQSVDSLILIPRSSIDETSIEDLSKMQVDLNNNLAVRELGFEKISDMQFYFDFDDISKKSEIIPVSQPYDQYF